MKSHCGTTETTAAADPIDHSLDPVFNRFPQADSDDTEFAIQTLRSLRRFSTNRLRLLPIAIFSGLILISAGCGTSRWSDTSRTATEQLVLSHAIDRAVSDLDFSSIGGGKVFFDGQYVDDVPNKGYLVSSIRQQLLAAGCRLQDDKTKADFIVEARAGASGTDRHDQLILGLPQMAMPSVSAGAPSLIPEIPLVKKTNQMAAAKIAVFVYDRASGEAIWQSGIAQHSSTAKNYWVFGAGPFESGSSRGKTKFGGADIGVPGLDGKQKMDSEYAEKNLPVARRIAWRNSTEQSSESSESATTAAAVTRPDHASPSPVTPTVLLGPAQ